MIKVIAPVTKDAEEFREMGHTFLEKIREECWDIIHVAISPKLARDIQKDGRRIWGAMFKRADIRAKGTPSVTDFLNAVDKPALYGYIQGIRTKVEAVAPKITVYQPGDVKSYTN